jgi:hypothetical protein
MSDFTFTVINKSDRALIVNTPNIDNCIDYDEPIDHKYLSNDKAAECEVDVSGCDDGRMQITFFLADQPDDKGNTILFLDTDGPDSYHEEGHRDLPVSGGAVVPTLTKTSNHTGVITLDFVQS